MKVSLIVAVDNENGIGKNNDLMWYLPADMKFFKETTTGHIVVMGRKNYESIPARFRPLPNRENAVLTRSTDFEAAGCVVFHSLEACFAHYQNETERTVFIIGGGEIYQQALNSGLISEMFITHVNHVYGADTFFPELEWRKWSQKVIMHQAVDDNNPVSFQVVRYTRQ